MYRADLMRWWNRVFLHSYYGCKNVKNWNEEKVWEDWIEIFNKESTYEFDISNITWDRISIKEIENTIIDLEVEVITDSYKYLFECLFLPLHCRCLFASMMKIAFNIGHFVAKIDDIDSLTVNEFYSNKMHELDTYITFKN
jgi:hypothetical protein